MSKILHIESATDVCSVVLAEGGKLVAKRELKEGRSHAKLLTVFIDEIFTETGLFPDAVAVSMGPGSYTGLRIGVSVAKGICYGRSVPLIAIPTLDAFCNGFIRRHPDLPSGARLAPMIDARRMEVYTALYSTGGEKLRDTHALIVDEHSFRSELTEHPVYLFGPGADKLTSVLNHSGIHIETGFTADAEYLVAPALERFSSGKFEDVAYFEPFYLKDFITTIPKKNVLGT